MYRCTCSLNSALDGVNCQRQALAALPPEREPVTIVHDAGLAPGPGWTCAENLAPPVFDSQTVLLY